VSKFLKLGLLLSLLLAAMTVQAAANSVNRDFQHIISSGELRVGVSLFPPWVMRDKEQQLVGSEIDMAGRLAKDMGLKLALKEYSWKQLIPALEKGEIDIIVSGMGIKPDRALRVNFSRPYGDSGIGLVTNIKLTKDFKNLQDLKQPTVNIGAIEETVSASVAQRLFGNSTLLFFATQKEAEAALLAGELHGFIAANPLPKFIALQHPAMFDVPLTKPLLSFKEGLAINKGDADLLSFLDAWVVSRSADGWIASTRRYWLETLEWKQD
jgi:polar amino acid transport system substrate-binding protein